MSVTPVVRIRRINMSVSLLVAVVLHTVIMSTKIQSSKGTILHQDYHDIYCKYQRMQHRILYYCINNNCIL